MKRLIISALLVTSVFTAQSFVLTGEKAVACTETYTWGTVYDSGEMQWVCYFGGQKVFGWQYVNGEWYYLYPSNGFMAHDTFVNGWYVDSNGAWRDIPYAVQKVIDVVPHPGMIYECGNEYGGENISLLYNQNLKFLCINGWSAPNVNGTLVNIGESGYFVADDGTVYKAPHQAYDTIYQYDSYGNVVKQYPYIENYNR